MPGLSILRRTHTPVPSSGRSAIIDIGSNSIRLVVYDGPARVPTILFNEKVMAGLGRGLARDGALDAESMARTLGALERFRRLALDMGVDDVRTVATAAVRDASNGPAFLQALREIGLAVTLLSGEEEAEAAGHGVLAAIPDADGIVGDLGGGSLELARVAQGEVRDRMSCPLGVLRLGAVREKGRQSLDRTVEKMLRQGGWAALGEGRPFYLVGGSWRALARLDMTLTGFPLPIVHHYAMAPTRPAQLVRTLARIDRRRVRAIDGIASARAATLDVAAALLAVLMRRLRASEAIVSAYGLREGLLHQSLPPDVRAADPLICAAREEGRVQGRFPEHGDVLDRWVAPLFVDEERQDRRLRHAACLLADIGWRAHPEFRAERGLDTALHGNWVGIDARGRAMLGRALYRSFGGDGELDIVNRLTTPEERARADRWGLALRLGQRLSGGIASALEQSRLTLEADTLTLHLAGADRALYGEAVERRHKALAGAFGRKVVIG